MTDALNKLIEEVEACGDWSLHLMEDALEAHDVTVWDAFVGAINGSLDAAKALHDALLPEWSLERLTMWPGSKCHACLWGTHEEGGERWHSFKDGRVDAEASTPARAWLLAVLRAYAARDAA